MTMYQVLVESGPAGAEACAFGEFESLASAVAATRGLVDDYLRQAHRPGMSAEALYFSYDSFGPLPSVVRDGDCCGFHARSYAWGRCEELCRAGAAPGRPEARSDPVNLATLLGTVGLSPQQDEQIARLLQALYLRDPHADVPVASMQVSPNGELLVVVREGTCNGHGRSWILLWSLRRAELLKSVAVDAQVSLVEFAPDGKTVAAQTHPFPPSPAAPRAESEEENPAPSTMRCNFNDLP
jgi:hypothetical protein